MVRENLHGVFPPKEVVLAISPSSNSECFGLLPDSDALSVPLVVGSLSALSLHLGSLLAAFRHSNAARWVSSHSIESRCPVPRKMMNN